MLFGFKSSLVASSMSVMTLAVGLTFSPLTNQKSLAQTTPTQLNVLYANFLNALFSGQNGWLATYGAPAPAVNPNVRFDSATAGGGAVVSAFLSRTPPSGTVSSPLSFAAVAAPLTAAQIAQNPAAVQAPLVGGAVALAYNPGLPSGIRLSRATYVGILNGSITNWNSSTIAADNPGKQLPNLRIRVVYRSDSSGTTFVLTNHLNTVASASWNRGVGNTVSWPSGFIGASGSSALINTVRNTPGAIGYVDNPAVSGTTLKVASLRNQAGNYVAPTAAATTAALSGASDSDPRTNIITVNVANPTQATAYPIVGVGYGLFYPSYSNSGITAGIKGFVNWALGSQGDSIATSKGYGPLPAALETSARNAVNGIR